MNTKKVGIWHIVLGILFALLGFGLGFVFPEANPAHQKWLYLGCAGAVVLGLIILGSEFLMRSPQTDGGAARNANAGK